MYIFKIKDMKYMFSRLSQIDYNKVNFEYQRMKLWEEYWENCYICDKKESISREVWDKDYKSNKGKNNEKKEKSDFEILKELVEKMDLCLPKIYEYKSKKEKYQKEIEKIQKFYGDYKDLENDMKQNFKNYVNAIHFYDDLIDYIDFNGELPNDDYIKKSKKNHKLN